MLRAGGAADAFIHQGTAQIIRARLQSHRRTFGAHLYPACLDIAEMRMKHQARDAVHQQRLTKAWAAARQAAQIHGRFHMHERQRHKFGKAAGLRLQIAQHQQMPRPMQGRFHMAEHDGGGTAQPQPMRGAHHGLPFFRVHLIRADDGAYFIIQNLRRRAR